MVYVDEPVWPYGRMMMCHMMADSLEELHEMAEKLGVRKWFQNKSAAPHYDICKSKRARAIELGAVEVNRKKTVEIIRFWREKKAKQG